MPSKVFSAANIGLNAQPIEVETDISYGLRRFDIVGLPDKAVEESEERVRSAIKSIGLKQPCSKPERVLLNLAPADLKKEGSLYDLAIALSYLLESKQSIFNPKDKLFFGELSLEGTLRPIKGALSFSMLAKEKGFRELILPRQNAIEAALSNQMDKDRHLNIIPANNLREVVEHLEGRNVISPFSIDLEDVFEEEGFLTDIGWIKGQETAKRAMEIAAAGGHNLLMSGPPGGGKSLLAKAMPSILPELNKEEVLEITKIYSFVGLLSKERPIITKRPFRTPHHSASKVSILGGGTPIKPGEITLAHRGILFLDEFPEFQRDTIEGLRQPMEDGKIVLLRANSRVTFPSQFTLIAAANPCPCGNLNNPFKPCVCSPSQINKYKRKLSGPIIDRIDILVELPYIKFEKLISPEEKNLSEKIRERVEGARSIQKERFAKESIFTNSEVNVPQIKKFCSIDDQTLSSLKRYVDRGLISIRGYHRVLKVARTIADLDKSKKVLTEHLQEALMYRLKDLKTGI